MAFYYRQIEACEAPKEKYALWERVPEIQSIKEKQNLLKC